MKYLLGTVGSFEIDVEPSTTIFALCNLIRTKERFPRSVPFGNPGFSLHFAGRGMGPHYESYSLQDLNIPNESTIYIVLRHESCHDVRLIQYLLA